MNRKLFGQSTTATTYIKLDTRKCKACWKCLKACKNQVIGKVIILWHKHALIVHPEACNGCLNCLNNCPVQAYSITDGNK